MVTKQLIVELQNIVVKNPEKANVEVCVYIMEPNIAVECPVSIFSIDDDFDDRIDINIT